MRDTVQEYYGSVLQSSNDLKTNACTTAAAPGARITTLMNNLHDEVINTYYGCGFVFPTILEGARVLDLGCGSGRDCYVLSQLVGEHGEVVGIDMTDQQLAIAERHVDYHADKFGYGTSNVSFLKGYIEHLNELPLDPNSFDVIVSNCVINLAVDKPAVLEHAHTLLKDGGEMYFSDVYCDRRVPQHVKQDPVLYGECLGGAMYWNDFIEMAKSAGFRDPRLVDDSVLTIDDESTRTKTGDLKFFSATYRLFKIAALEPACEDYGQAVVYRGGVPEQPDTFVLDKHHHLQRNRVFPVCGNTWRMLNDTRYQEFFDFIGNWDTHFGIFEGCGTTLPFETDPQQTAVQSGGCC